MADETPVTLDDLQVLDFFNPFPQVDSLAYYFVVCTRCSGLVSAETVYREEHKRWHAAIEDLSITGVYELPGPFGAMMHLGPIEAHEAAASVRSEQPHPEVEACRVALASALGGAAATVTFDELCEVVEGIGRDNERLREQYKGLSRGETDRLRRVEDALVAVGAPNRSDPGDPGGLVVAWIQRQAALMNEWRRRDEAATKVIGDLSKRPTTDAYQRAYDAIEKRRADLVEALGMDPVAGFYDALDVVRKQQIELAAHRGIQDTSGADFTETAEGVELTPGQWIARFFSLPADARLEWAEHYQAEARRSADCFRMNHLRRLADADDFHKRLMAVVVRRADLAALEAHGGVLGFLDQELGWLATYRKTAAAEADPQRNAEVLTDQMLHDLLSLVSVTVHPDVMASWTPEQREQAARWAGAVHLDASDNDVDVPERPAFLNEQPSEPCPSLRLDSAGVLHACTVIEEHHVHKGSVQPNGMVEVWTSNAGVPVPWPLDQEPPTGINTLHDPDAAPDTQSYLVRLQDGTWEWFADPNDQSGPRVSNEWRTAVLDADGDLHVVRP